MGSVSAGSETGRAEVPAAGAALGLQCAHGYAEQWPQIGLKTTSLCDAEPRCASFSRWWLGHPDVARAQMLQPCPLLQHCACRKGRLGTAQSDSALDQK